MIMCAGVPCKISWRGLVVVGLLVLAALPGWTSGQQEAEKPKPIAPVAVPPPVQEPPAPTPAPAIAEVPPLPAPPGIAVDYGYPIPASEPGDQDARLKAIEAQLQFLLKEVQGMRKAPGSKERGVRSSTPPPVRYVPNTPSIIAPVPPVGVRGQNASGEITR